MDHRRGITHGESRVRQSFDRGLYRHRAYPNGQSLAVTECDGAIFPHVVFFQSKDLDSTYGFGVYDDSVYDATIFPSGARDGSD